MSDKLTPAGVLRARFHIEQQLSAPGSLSGYQADRLAMGLSGPSGNGARSDGAERLRSQLADLVLLCRGLTAEEELVCKLKYGAAGQIATYRQYRRPCDMRPGDGEEVIRAVTEHEGFVEVEGKQNLRPVSSKIASQTGLTARQVQSRISSALGKIARALKHCEQVSTASAHVDF
jgi:hypothetical protein